jgi:ectoine hydroxylase-related dioxygenase (phytanoyl-CoA dioxygenase family)
MKARAKSDFFPTLAVSPAEKEQGSLNPETVKNGFELYQKNGCLLVKNVFEADFVRELYDFHYQTYRNFFDEGEFENTMVVGDQRRMITFEIKGLFNSPDIYANPLIFQILEKLLSQNIILSFFGSVTSYPGAPDQHTHRDNPHIFDQPDVYDGGEKVLPFLPPYALSVAIPLVPMNEINGTNRMFLGSHLVTLKDVRRSCEYSHPIAELGDCVMMDWRTVHGGTANRSENIRPVIYLEYFRQWYRDVLNPKKHILISPAEYAKIPEEKRYLFNWSMTDADKN